MVTTPPSSRPSNAPWLAALLLLTLAAFWPVGRLGFIGYDDIDYVYQNAHVRAGLGWDNLVWAFAAPHAGNWHPLTWLSHMLDCDLFGLDPGAHHLVNLAFHTATTLLLFLLLEQLTGARWRSFLVAGLFGWHPLHVQSVAWIAERKDVLSGFFAMLTLLAYARYRRTQKVADYLLALLLFALGLLAKPMLVTLPIVMLLLDFWPLGRAGLARPVLPAWWPLVREKIPFLVLSQASSLVTFWAQKSGGAIVTLKPGSALDRGLHVLVAYPQYLEKIGWPAQLAIFYPFPRARPEVLAWLGALALLVGLTLLVWWRRRSQPWLLVGWLWFFIMLLPVIGLVQIGSQSIADRYTYLPSIGLFILAAWGLAELAGVPATGRPRAAVPPTDPAPPLHGRASPARRYPVAVTAGLVLAACFIDTRHQLGFWRDNITLFQHVVAVTPQDNDLGDFYLGISYAETGNLPVAADCLTAALRISPDFLLARERLGNVRLVEKKYAAAELDLAAVVQVHPDYAPARVALGLALAGQQKYARAQAEYLAAQQLLPDNPEINRLLEANAPPAAAETLTGLLVQVATQSTPALHLQIARLERQLGNYRASVNHYEAALVLAPGNVEGLNNLAWLLATCPDATVRNGPRAVQLAEQACSSTGFQKTVFMGTLAAAQAEAGRFDDAVATAQKACANASARQETGLLQANQSLLARYQSHQAYHETPPIPIDDR